MDDASGPAAQYSLVPPLLIRTYIMSAVKSGVKKIWHTLQGHGGGGDASRSSREEEQQASATGGGKSGGISFGAAEVVDDDGDGEEGLVEAGESFSLKPNGSESPSAQPKKPGRVTVSLPEEDKPKKVKRSKTQGTPGSVGTGYRRHDGRECVGRWMFLRMCAICTRMAGMVYLWSICDEGKVLLLKLLYGVVCDNTEGHLALITQLPRVVGSCATNLTFLYC